MILDQLPIRKKITAVIMFISIVVLAVTVAAFMTYDLVTLRATLVAHLATLGRVVADNSSAALAFQDEKDATDTLSYLRNEPQIVAAAIYDANGKVFATYSAAAPPEQFPPAPAPSGLHVERGKLVLYEPIVRQGAQLGTLCLKADLHTFYQQLEFSAGVAALILCVSLGVALVLSDYLQKRISAPIIELAHTARAISERRDYSVRAPKVAGDELGLLTDAFNQMLTRIEGQTAALRQNEARLRLALEASATGAWDWDITTNHILWDANSPSLFGRKPDEFGDTFEDFLNLIHPDDREMIRRVRQQALDEKKELISEFRVAWPDGSLHYLHTRGRAFYGADGKPFRMTGVTQDITERRRNEEARRYLAAIVESSDDAIVGKDLNGTVTSWNHGAERLYGYAAEEIVGKSIMMAIPADRRHEEEQILKRIARGERIVHYETIRRRKDGSLFEVSLTVSPINDAAGKIVGASKIARDITERRRIENEIRHLNAQLQRHTTELERRVRERTAELTAANQELESFAYSVAHDLRAPLRHIDAFAKILRDDFSAALPDEASRILEIILSGCRHMSQLVDDLLNLAHVSRQELKSETVGLKSLVESIIADLKRETAERQIEWRVGNLPAVNGDPGLVRQVFSNLLSNAVKYTRPRHPAVIEIGSQSAEGEKVIYVRDNGVGFNMKYADKLFGPFQRLHRAEEFEGTGVGLAIVDRVVRRHGGRIWAEAEVGKGATFYLTLNGAEQSNR